jgi:chaperonin GroES
MNPPTTERAPAHPVGFRPLADRILVRPDKAADRIGSILLPKATRAALQKQMNTGVVLACGPGMLMANGERWPMPCEPGEHVLYAVDGPVHIRIDGEELLLMRDDFVYLAFEEEETLS